MMPTESECHVEPIDKLPTSSESDQTTLANLSVQGMGCANCATRVRNSLLQLQGVVEANVDHVSGGARVVYNKTMVNESELVLAVVRAGGDGRHNYYARPRI